MSETEKKTKEPAASKRGKSSFKGPAVSVTKETAPEDRPPSPIGLTEEAAMNLGVMAQLPDGQKDRPAKPEPVPGPKARAEHNKAVNEKFKGK